MLTQDLDKSPRIPTTLAAAVIARIRFDAKTDQNIETLLSRCEAYLQIHDDAQVAEFISFSKKIILDKCSVFLKTITGNS